MRMRMLPAAGDAWLYGYSTFKHGEVSEVDQEKLPGA